jgi:hypothetical protein
VSEERLSDRGVKLAPQATQPVGPVDRLIVATTWSGPLILARLHEGEPDPTQAELDAMADELSPYGGVKPTVRVLERPPVAAPGGRPGSTPR